MGWGLEGVQIIKIEKKEKDQVALTHLKVREFKEIEFIVTQRSHKAPSALDEVNQIFQVLHIFPFGERTTLPKENGWMNFCCR